MLFFTVFIMQLTMHQRVFLVTTWMRYKSHQFVSQESLENFPERNVPNKTTICKNVNKYREDCTKRIQGDRLPSGEMFLLLKVGD